MSKVSKNNNGLTIQGVLLLTPKVVEDQRGKLTQFLGPADGNFPADYEVEFVLPLVVRGNHLHPEETKVEIMRASYGRVAVVLLDQRKKSPTFGQSAVVVISASDRMIRVPTGVAHALFNLTQRASVHVRATEHHVSGHDIAFPVVPTKGYFLDKKQYVEKYGPLPK